MVMLLIKLAQRDFLCPFYGVQRIGMNFLNALIATVCKALSAWKNLYFALLKNSKIMFTAFVYAGTNNFSASPIYYYLRF